MGGSLRSTVYKVCKGLSTGVHQGSIGGRGPVWGLGWMVEGPPLPRGPGPWRARGGTRGRWTRRTPGASGTRRGGPGTMMDRGWGRPHHLTTDGSRRCGRSGLGGKIQPMLWLFFSPASDARLFSGRHQGARLFYWTQDRSRKNEKQEEGMWGNTRPPGPHFFKRGFRGLGKRDDGGTRFSGTISCCPLGGGSERDPWAAV